MEVALADVHGERLAFESSLLPATRKAGLLGALLVLVVFPLWGVFDYLLEPALAAQLIRARGLVMLPIVIATIVIWRGGSRTGLLYFAIFAMITLPELAIAWMIPRVAHLEAYLIGFALVITAAGALMVLPMRWYLAIVLASLVAVAAMLLLHPRSAHDVAIITFFLGTATLISGAIAWLVWRMRLTQFRTMSELESRRSQTHDLLQQVMRLSNEDDLTGLPNRRHFRRELEDAVRSKLPLCAAVIDVNRFKQVNDQHGHDVGDTVLVAIAQLLRVEFARSGMAARLGGDEFAVLLLGDDLAQRLSRVQEQVVSGREPALAGFGVSLSVGIATHLPGESAQELIRRADKAQYRAKNGSRGLCVDGED